MEKLQTKIEQISQQIEKLQIDLAVFNRKTEKEDLRKIPEEQKWKEISEIEKTNKNILEEFGAKVIVTHHFWREKEILPTKINLGLKDPVTFLNKLEDLSLSREKITRQLVFLLKNIARGLAFQIERDGKKEVAEPALIAKLNSLPQIIIEYKMADPRNEQGLFEAVSPLEEYSKANQEGYLREFLLVKESDLGGSISEWQQYLSPLNWHREALNYHGREERLLFYKNKWKKALELLKEVAKNPKAEKFYQELKERIFLALPDIEMKIKFEVPDPLTAAEFLNILAKVKEKLYN